MNNKNRAGHAFRNEWAKYVVKDVLITEMEEQNFYVDTKP